MTLASARMPPPRAARAQGTGWGEAVFEAACAGGVLRLGDVSAAPGPSALDAALVLARLEPLLTLLDAWAADTDGALDWRAAARADPAVADAACAARATGAAHAAHAASAATAQWQLGEACGALSLPWPALARWGAPPPRLAAALHWVPAQLHWELALAALTADERQRLHVGAWLLLSPQAPVRLLAEGVPLDGWRWQLDAGGRLTRGEPASAAPPPLRLRGRLPQADVAAALGWTSQGLAPPAPDVVLALAPAQPLARARLCACPLGQAVVVTALDVAHAVHGREG